MQESHQEVAAQDFLGSDQNEITVAVAQDGRDQGLDRHGPDPVQAGFLPGQQFGGHRHPAGLEEVQGPFQGLAPGLVRGAPEQGR